jgi:hypothetical protein
MRCSKYRRLDDQDCGTFHERRGRYILLALRDLGALIIVKMPD